jgi:hypothetical protein
MAATPIALFPQARHLNFRPSLRVLGLGPPVGWRVRLADLKVTNLPHVEEHDGLRLPGGRDGGDPAALGGLNQAPGMPPRR